MLISSQTYRDEELVEAKAAAGDYTVSVSPEFELGGETYQVVLDGHHSLSAAQAAGIEPVLVVLSAQECDAIALLDGGDIEAFLAAVYVDGDYYDVSTGCAAF